MQVIPFRVGKKVYFVKNAAEKLFSQTKFPVTGRLRHGQNITIASSRKKARCLHVAFLEINIFRVTTLFPKRVSWTIDLWNEVSRLFMLIFITPLYFVKKQIKLSKLSPFYCHTGSSSEKCASDFSIEIYFL